MSVAVFSAFLGRLDICDTGELLDDDDFDQTDASFAMRPFAHLSNAKLDKTVSWLCGSALNFSVR